MTPFENQFLRVFKEMSEAAFNVACASGFHDKPVEHGTRIALITSELSEALEAIRHGNPPDDKIPEFTGLEAELADAVIRIMDFSETCQCNTGGAIVAKMRYNATRPHMHGGKAF